jgi:hypothetical protein
MYSRLCSEILNLRLQSGAGRERELKVNLEEIWSSGALFLTDVPIRSFTPLRFAGGSYEFRGKVIARTLLGGLGYFIEIRFHPGCTWSEQKYRPKHLFNPLVLLANRIFEATPLPPSSPSESFLPATFARRAASESFKQAPGQAF